MSEPPVSHRRHRLEVRVTDALIRQAAELEDSTVTAFVLDWVAARASQGLEQHRNLVLFNAVFDPLLRRARQAASSGCRTRRTFRSAPKLPE